MWVKQKTPKPDPLGHSSPILSASFSPTGNQLATGSGDTNARLWDLNTETPSYVLSGHKGWVLCVEWEAMERKLATGGHDGHVRISSQAIVILRGNRMDRHN
jgi:ribosome assembly protein 4